jgi:hypothetical protein
LLSAGALAFTWKTHRINRERRLEEKAPTFAAVFDHRQMPGRDKREPVVGFTYMQGGPDLLDEVEFELVLNSAAKNPPLVGIARPMDEFGPLKALAEIPMHPGMEALMRVARHDAGSGGDVPFRVRCRSGKNRWTVTVYCHVPGVPKVY